MYMFPVIYPIFTDVQNDQLLQVTYTLYDRDLVAIQKQNLQLMQIV